MNLNGRLRWRTAGRARGVTANALLRVIQNPAALLAADDLLAALHPVSGLRGDFHVATGANIVLERDDRRIAFAGKKPFEAIEYIFINFAGQLGAFFRQFVQTRFQRFAFGFEIGHLPRDRNPVVRGRLLFLRRDFRPLACPPAPSVRVPGLRSRGSPSHSARFRFAIARNSSFLRVSYCCVFRRLMLSVRVPTSSSSFLRSTSSCCAFA